MIKINLLPQRKAKRADKAQQTLAAGVLSIIVAAAAVFFLVHQPLVNQLDEKRAENAKIQDRLKELQQKASKLPQIKKAFAAAEKAQQAIDSLQQARAVPAWFLYELASILTKDSQPTMTKEMARKVKEDPNRGWSENWDGKNVWITSFSEKGGKFTLKGGAQSDTDMTQLALRLQASVFFRDVTIQHGGEAKGKRGISYYNFNITGRVVY